MTPRRPSPYDNRLYRANRKLVLAGNPRCWLCGGEGANTVDHVNPVSTSGIPDHSLTNLRPAHKKCNSIRGNRQKKLRIVGRL